MQRPTAFLTKACRLVSSPGLLAALALAAQSGGAGAEGRPPALKLRPAERAPTATSAMILGAGRAGGRLVAVGDHGIVLLSDDGGATFRQAKSVPVRSTLTAVSFADDRAGWAVGHWGVILSTADAGETWQLQRSDTSVDQPFFSVYFKDRERGWAVGLWSLFVATKDGGRTWEPVRLPPPPGGGRTDRNLLEIFAGPKGTLFVAAEQGTVLRSEDGSVWSYGLTGYKGTFWSGTSLPDGTVLVGGLRGTIYRSTDDGRTWAPSESGVKSSITDLAAAGGKVYAVGLDGVALASADGGATFQATQREDRVPLTALAVSDRGRVVAFSKQGVVADFRPPGDAAANAGGAEARR